MPLVSLLSFLVQALLLWQAAPAARPPVQTQQGCAGDVSVLYPPQSAVLSIGNGHTFLSEYFAVQSCVPRVCRYSEDNVSYDKMKLFTNPGVGLYQTNLFIGAAGKHYTYYISCRGTTGSATAPVKLSFSLDDKPSTICPIVRATARSATSVQVAWATPDAKLTKGYKVYRDGVPIANSPFDIFVDRDVKPDTLYHYSVAAVYASGEQPAGPPVPAHTLPVSEPVAATPLMLDDFESPVRVVNPHLPEPNKHNLWSVYPYGDLSKVTASTGMAVSSTEDAHSGKSSLAATVTGEVPKWAKKPGGLYLLFYPYTEKDNHWHFLHEYLLSPGQWKHGVYNRLRFWIKVPKSFEKIHGAPGLYNCDIGTYVRSTGGNSIGSGGSESGIGGGHFYHRFNIPYSGQWHQVILDAHPTHSRGNVGYFELGDIPYPTGEPGYTYFDLLTTFYIDLSSATPLATYPSTFYLDDFELYSDPNPENTDQVFSLNGVYIPERHEVFVGWRRPKNEEKIRHEVRYSFEDIFKTGWAAAKPAPNGTVSPSGGINGGMEYSSTNLPLTGHDRVWIGIKPENSQRFRQIVIPLTGSR